MGGVYFICANVFVPFVRGSEPYKLARAFAEDNAEVMLLYFILYASAWSSLRQSALDALSKLATGSKREHLQQKYDNLFSRMEGYHLRPIKVRLRQPIGYHAAHCEMLVPVCRSPRACICWGSVTCFRGPALITCQFCKLTGYKAFRGRRVVVGFDDYRISAGASSDPCQGSIRDPRRWPCRSLSNI